jgi:hypothetical protein
MTRIALPAPNRSRTWFVVLGIAVLIGAYLRLDQISMQVLIDDEWHAVHQFITRTPREMFFDFGYADYSIPLGILDWYQAQAWGVSELTLRWPMIACGLAALVLMPLYVAPRLGHRVAAVFALLIALSPLLVIFTRMARPYAITLLLGWVAHAAYQQYYSAGYANEHANVRGQWAAGAIYVVATALATWLHPVVGPFVFAPLLWGLTKVREALPAERGAAFRRWLVLAVATVSLTAAVVLPPLLAHPMALAAKGGSEGPGTQTLVGVWYAWFGTPSTFVVLACIALASYGARPVWRAMTVARTGVLGLGLTLALIAVTGPMWSHLPVTVSRYLLPVVPLLLLTVAAGAVRVATHIAIPPTAPRRVLAWLALAFPVALVCAQSPLAPLLRHPNSQTQHLVNYIDFRPDKNPYVPQFEAMPLSPYWATLASRPPGTVRIAAAPFYFESYDWDAPRWERLSTQTVLPGYLTGLCVDRRSGELPQDPRYRFANAVHLADDAELDTRKIDFVAWQKPYILSVAGHTELIGADTASCESILREKFGLPVFEDSHIIVFPVPQRNRPAAHAPR